MHRRHYSEEEKNAVMSRYAAGGEEVKSMLAEYGIPKSTFNQWLREYDVRYGCISKYDFSPRNFRNILRRKTGDLTNLRVRIGYPGASGGGPMSGLRHFVTPHIRHGTRRSQNRTNVEIPRRFEGNKESSASGTPYR